MRAIVCALVVASTLATTAYADAALDMMMSRMEGTSSVKVEPYMREGKLTGCLLVFDAVVQDHVYRQGKYLQLSGNVGVMKVGDTFGSNVKLVVNEVALNNGAFAFIPAAPTRVYLVGPDYQTNLASMVSASASDVPGGIFAIFQLAPTIDMLVEAMGRNQLTVAFNSNNGESDIKVDIDLNVESVNALGERTRSMKYITDYQKCFEALRTQRYVKK